MSVCLNNCQSDWSFCSLGFIASTNYSSFRTAVYNCHIWGNDSGKGCQLHILSLS